MVRCCVPANAVPEITPRALAARAALGETLQLIDVREPHEWEIAHRKAPVSSRLPHSTRSGPHWTPRATVRLLQGRNA